MKAAIFHGTHGTPNGNWFPWLASQLKTKNWVITVPEFPTPKNQSLENWLEIFQETAFTPDVVVGHSLGSTFCLRLLERDLIEPDKVVLTGCVIDKIDNEEYDRLNDSFINHPFDWKFIKKKCNDIEVLHGDNDPYVPLAQAECVSKNLDTPLKIIKNGGHLNSECGYTEFPELLKYFDNE